MTSYPRNIIANASSSDVSTLNETITVEMYIPSKCLPNHSKTSCFGRPGCELIYFLASSAKDIIKIMNRLLLWWRSQARSQWHCKCTCIRSCYSNTKCDFEDKLLFSIWILDVWKVDLHWNPIHSFFIAFIFLCATIRI